MNPLTRGRNRNNTSGYAGVSFNPGSQRWQAQITHKKQHHFIGLFNTPEEASKARNKMAKRLTRLDSGLPV